MKYLGIDFGTKYVGLALSDDGGMMAFPETVMPKEKCTPEYIRDLIADRGVGAVVVGYSLGQKGKENKVATDARSFIGKLGVAVPVYWQDERFSSLEASRHKYDSRPIANPRRQKKDVRRDDDSAAAIILQRFLDKQT